MISFMVAMDQNRLIGKDNDLPWRLPADLAYFKKVTMGKPIVMGRKTHESIGRPLPGRENIIITRNEDYQAEGCTVVNSVAEIERFDDDTEVFVIGGAEIFKETLPIADRLYITLIEEEFEGDTYFPEIKEDEWELTSEERGTTDEKNRHKHRFLVYERKAKQA
ncbi:dihydrofolate reductase [Desertibacillus haloalkaliphilus]|uniref:dihydrofolate reductase n=1 Tax=Desertibacillus haloalkaliphilus TaxID=1328930 RepID=UPI001C25B0F9|nr:dihydrofolate reductase [Desertibacillus haloalkaliphilus]MBU8906581.1 dihydrofolate reductase [Desertibacillus haloalkaliphilus]